MKRIKYAGIDDHKDFLFMAVITSKKSDPGFEEKISNEENRIKRFFKKISKDASKIHVVYEAGCLGFTLKRYLDGLKLDCKINCIIAAPSKTPRRKGERVKTDRIDARKLAHFLRSGDLEEIYIPTLEQEAVRDYLRTRNSLREDLTRCKLRVTSFLNRTKERYTGANWTTGHRKWIKELVFDDPIKEMTCKCLKYRVFELEAHLEDMDMEIVRIAECEPFAEPVSLLRAFHGIDYLTAMFFICEVGDFRRFPSAEAFMSFLEIVPCEYSSGSKRSQFDITKTGNSNLRRLLIEAAWQHKYYRPASKALRARRVGVPAENIAYADKAQRRLCKKYQKMFHRGKLKQTTVTAVGRELAGFIREAMVGQTA